MRIEPVDTAAQAESLTAGTSRAATALWVCLIALALSRAITVYTPSMWFWGLNVRRFLGPDSEWLNWLDVAVGVVLPLTTLLVPVATSLGNSIVRLPAISSMVAATLLASLAWLLPDRLLFTGDFLMRQGTVTQGKSAAVLFPQALPLDVLLHVELPRFLVAHGGLSSNGSARLIGVFEVAVLALLALVFVRALALRGPAALAAASTVICGGYLGLFTGYGKSFAELCLVTVAVGAFGVRAVREGGGLLPLSLAISAGIALHRSGLAFLPVLPVVWMLWWNRHGRDGAWRRPAALAAFALPLVTLAAMAPRILAAMRVRDAAHFLPADARSVGVLQAAFSGTRALDLANLAALLSPLAPAIPLIALGFGPPLLRRREGWVLGALALPLVGMMPFVHPSQGVFRDWDIFAASGVALSLIAAWLVGEVVRSPRHAALGVAVMVGVALPSVQWLAHLSDFERGAERVRAFVTETPQRTGDERATTWEFLGNRSFSRKHWEDASLAYRNAAEQAPNPRLFAQWGMAEAMQGHYLEAQGLYARAVERNPDFTMAWLGLATSSTWLDDTATCARATRAIQQLNPNHEQLPALYDYLESMHRPPSR